jgi:processive 1,2-diacylglycerol beta-glucosyltransferase
MKILIIHATAGAGHKKAAEAIYHGLKAKTPYEAVLVDALDYSNPIFKYSYPNFYAFVVSHMPWLWAFVFGVMDIPALQGIVRRVRRIYNTVNTQRLHKFLIQEQFDWIICTQFLSAEVSGYLKRTGQIKSKVMCVVTDFDVHRIWINEGVDFYTGACDYTRDKLLELGVPKERAFVTGIPTDPKFQKQWDVPSIRRQLGLDEQAITTLVATGSFGFGPIEELVDILKSYQLIVVCGHNKALFDRLTKRALPHVKVCGLVSNMDELMAASDIMVTKPGGLSIAEALVKGLVLVFFSAIPGQETNNVKVLMKYNIGLGQLYLREIADALRRLYSSAQELSDQRARSKGFAKPWAVDDIIRIINIK